MSPPCLGFPDILGHLPRALRGWYLRAVDRFAIDPVLAPGVDAFRAELGLPRAAAIVHHGGIGTVAQALAGSAGGAGAAKRGGA